eukprot:365303-Chlamydomonas_euryale.AAC.62
MFMQRWVDGAKLEVKLEVQHEQPSGHKSSCAAHVLPPSPFPPLRGCGPAQPPRPGHASAAPAWWTCRPGRRTCRARGSQGAATVRRLQPHLEGSEA